jgi:hypothetical protein
MAKVNVNTASREELLGVGGLRPEIADEILKLRRKAKITDVEALNQVPGVGPATLEQLKKALDFSDPPRDGGNSDDRDQERERGGRDDERRGGAQSTWAMPETVRDATRADAEAAEAKVGGGLRGVQRAAEATAEIERAVARRSAEGTAELGRALVDLTVAQTRQNLETLRGLTEAVDWDQIAEAVDWSRVHQLQAEYLRVSLERAAEIARRYLEVGQAAMNAATDTARDQARKAA